MSMDVNGFQERKLAPETRKDLCNRIKAYRLDPNASIDDILYVTGEILCSNPDFLTAWNLRRRALRQILSSGNLEDIKKYFTKEVLFGIEAIKAMPKFYGGWYQRWWLMTTLKSAAFPLDATLELNLCTKLFELDPRNFFCWNYRWFLMEQFPEQITLQSEFDYNTSMIYRNFGNYSAWHRRCLFIRRFQESLTREALEVIIKDDLNLIKNAYFTDPSNQGSWFYLRWLVQFCLEWKGEERDVILQSQLDDVDELLSVEPDCALALFFWVDFAIKLTDKPVERITERLHLLMDKDSHRRGMYRDKLKAISNLVGEASIKFK